MNSNHDSKPKRPGAKLIRTADGALRPAGEETDIGDVWEQQRRIRLQESIEEDRKKATRQQIRKQKGLVGLAKTESSKLFARTKTELFGEQSQSSPKAKPDDTPVAKTVEINIAMPALPKLNLKAWVAAILRAARKVPRRIYLIGSVAVAVVVIGLITYHLIFGSSTQNSGNGDTSASGQTPKLVRGTPTYATLLPAGKTIGQLGGWTRVSPPNTDPVYAYVDRIGQVQVDVSEQPLPPNLQTPDEIAKLAEGFNATQKLSAEGVTAYLGTSAKGPQSLIMSKSNLLILIKSTTLIANDQWTTYINSLQ